MAWSIHWQVWKELVHSSHEEERERPMVWYLEARGTFIIWALQLAKEVFVLKVCVQGGGSQRGERAGGDGKEGRVP